MKKFVLIPDSFKGTLSSQQICDIIAQRVQVHFPNNEIVSIPVADGGEGSVDCFLSALGGEKVSVPVTDLYFETMDAFYGLIHNGKTAVMEMAACAGHSLIQPQRKDPRITTTFGVGQLILAAARSGVRDIVVGLGGSATNDAGCGAAAAVGVVFRNESGESFVPTGGTLKDIASIDLSQVDPILSTVTITTMCDIDNPMYGPTGASYIFGPQKGAHPAMVEELDQGMKHLAKVIERDLKMDLSTLPGGGAAGAMGVGMVAFFNSKLKMGIETVLDTVDFDKTIEGADFIFTGEGKIDSQSLRGKVVIGVSRRGAKQNIPVIAVVGGAGDGAEGAYAEGVTAIVPINRLPEDFEVSRHKSEENLTFAVDNVLRLLACQ